MNPDAMVTNKYSYPCLGNRNQTLTRPAQLGVTFKIYTVLLNKSRMPHAMDQQPRKPRKIMAVRPSKYEFSAAVHANKEYWTKKFEEVDHAVTEPSAYAESAQIRKVLPSSLYQRVCNILNMPKVDHVDEEEEPQKEKPPRRMKKEPMFSTRRRFYIDRELDSDTDVEFSSSDEETPNIHRELLKKPEREQITWNSHYLQPEKEEEKSLVTKSDDVTNRIATEFCQYMTELGGDQQSQLFNPKAIKELFQVEFDTHAARGLQVVSKEIPAVIEKIAVNTGNPEKSQTAVIEREVTKDIVTERRPDKTQAFGYSLPTKDQWRAPRNNTKEMWRSARHVPKDLVTLKTVWEGITNLRSVREYCRWMIEHPEYRRAPYLLSLGMFDRAVLDARMTIELKSSVFSPIISPSDIPAPIDHIRRRLSQLAEETENS